MRSSWSESVVRLALRVRFLGPAGLLLGSLCVLLHGVIFGHLGSSWARFGSSWALLGSLLGTLDSILQSYNLIRPSTRQLIIPSTYGWSALGNPGRRTARSDYITNMCLAPESMPPNSSLVCDSSPPHTHPPAPGGLAEV